MINDKIMALLNLKLKVNALELLKADTPYLIGYQDALFDVLKTIDAQVNEIMNDIAVGMEK